MVRQKEERARVAVTRGNQGWPAAVTDAPGWEAEAFLRKHDCAEKQHFWGTLFLVKVILHISIVLIFFRGCYEAPV